MDDNPYAPPSKPTPRKWPRRHGRNYWLPMFIGMLLTVVLFGLYIFVVDLIRIWSLHQAS